MSVTGIITKRGVHPESILKEFRPAVKNANIKTVFFWHKGFLTIHFTERGFARYRMQFRGRAYTRRKLRITGQNQPLVFTGTLRKNATTRIRVAGTSKRVRGTMPGTQVANLRRGSGPNLRDEMTRVIRSEEKEMGKFNETTTAEQLRRIRGQKTEVVK